MSTRGWFEKSVLNPRGAWPLLSGKRQGNPSRANVAQNVRINPAIVTSRPGTSAVLAVSGRITGLTNWDAPGGDNFVFYQEGTSVRRYRQSDGNVATLFTDSTARRQSLADMGARMFLAGYSTAGAGTHQVRIHDGTNTDTAFRAPLAFTAITPTDGGAGLCTAGQHFIGFVFQSRNGFTGKPTTTVGSSPVSVTLNAGLRKISIAITLSTPADAGGDAALYPIMTRSDNPAKWFFVKPDAYSPSPISVPASTAGWTATITINVSDEDLALGDSADEYFNLLTQAGDGTGPFSPAALCAYGTRMVYCNGVEVYASDQNDPQHITADLHLIQNLAKRRVATAFTLAGSTDLFLSGPKWTGRVTENGDVPATWPQPVNVSTTLGAAFPNCVCPGVGRAWIATEAGVYLFNGAFPDHPITYLWSDWWARVNWKAAYAVEMADDTTNLKLYVAVPLDGATEPTHLLVIDYTNGSEWASCDITADVFNRANFSSVGVIKEYASGKTNLWIGPSAAGNITHFDTSTHNDEGAAVHYIWKSGYVRQPGEIQSKLIRVGFLDVWARGAGTPTVTVFSLDDAESVVVTLEQNDSIAAALSSAPGLEYQSRFDLDRIENFSVQFEGNSAGGWIELSGFNAFMKPSLYSR